MKLQFTRHGLASDPAGRHVTMAYRGRTLLGEVQSAEFDHTTGTIRLSVNHFNGEPWPFSPPARSVEVLDRD